MTLKIAVTRGLPGSGKTTGAKDWVAEEPRRRVRVSRDDLREMLFGVGYEHDNEAENLVTLIEESTVRHALKKGYAPIVDAMHLRSRYVRRWEKVAPVELLDFPASVNDCVRADAARERFGGRGVGEEVIRKIAERFHIPADGSLPKCTLNPELHLESSPKVRGVDPEWTPAPAWDPELPSALIVDIDGTLADLSHRSPYSQNADDYAKDGVFEDVVRLVSELSETHHIICVSGRSEEFRSVTTDWLIEQALVRPDELHMRSLDEAKQMVPDDIVKSGIFDTLIAGRYNVVGVIDDRPRVLRMWRAKGLTTFAVGPQDKDF